PSPVPTGGTSNCAAWHLAMGADTCDSIASQGGVTLADFKAWNPGVGDACGGLVPDIYVCVGRGAGTSPSSSAAVPSTTTSSGVGATPTPIQDGMVGGCRKFYFVESGDGTERLADHTTRRIDLYLWNPAVNNGGECVELWSSVFVCVGV
ncbi:hypothetical protein LZ30DRAFT_534920, partial [Colletotrichum cereale]